MSERVSKTCPVCHMRYRVAPIALNEHYNPIDLTPQQIRWLENAARVFDEESPELFTASAFLSWLKPDLTPAVPVPHFDGISRAEGGHVTGSRSARHTSPFALPQASDGVRRAKKRPAA